MRVAITFICAAGLYLLLSGQLGAQDLWAAVGCGALAAAADALVRRCLPKIETPARLWGSLIVAIARLPPSTARTAAGLVVTVATGRAPSADEPRKFVRGGDTAADRGRRALWIIGESLTPDGFVIGFHRGRAAAEMHGLRGEQERGQ